MTNDNEMNEQETPHISVNAQYIKDLSFENPGAPESLAKMSKNPQIELSLDLNVKNLEEDNYFEVEIVIEAKAMIENQKLYLVDLKYAGVFNLINVAADEQQFILAVHCPNIIFPYVRKMIADITQSGGFQPLMIDPINFGALYQKKMLDGQH